MMRFKSSRAAGGTRILPGASWCSWTGSAMVVNVAPPEGIRAVRVAVPPTGFLLVRNLLGWDTVELEPRDAVQPRGGFRFPRLFCL